MIRHINGNSVIFAGNYIISGNDQGYICIWDIQTNKLVRNYKTWHKQAISSLFYDSKEDLLIIGSKDGMLNALHLKSFIDIRVDNILSSKNIENYKIWLRDIQKFNDKEITFYITKSQSKIILWKLNDDQCIEPLYDLTLARIDSRFYCMAINPSGKKVVVGGNFGLGIWDIENTHTTTIHTSDIMDIKFLNQEHFVVCHKDGKASIWKETDLTYNKVKE